MAFGNGLLTYCTMCTLISLTAVIFCRTRASVMYTKEESDQHIKDLEKEMTGDPCYEIFKQAFRANNVKEVAYCLLFVCTYIPGLNFYMWKELFSPIEEDKK